jgi:hypothetical protein
MEDNRITSVKITSRDGVSICVAADGKGGYEKVIAQKTRSGQEQIVRREPTTETCDIFFGNVLEQKAQLLREMQQKRLIVALLLLGCIKDIRNNS